MSECRNSGVGSSHCAGRRSALVRGLAASLGAAVPWRAARAASVGVSDTELRLGQSTALTGPLAPLAALFNSGARACFDLVNRQGGINGRHINLVSKDDGYVPANTVNNVRAFADREDVLALFGNLGVPNTLAALPIAAQAKLPYLFPMNGDASVRQTPNRYFFTTTASFNDEVDRLVEHLVTVAVKRISVACLSNSFGEAISNAASRALTQHGLTAHSVVSFDLQGGNLEAAARQIVASNPAAVVLGAFGLPAARFIQAFKAAKGTGQIATFSGVGTDLLFRELGAGAAGTIVSQVVPFPWSPAIPIVREYQVASKAASQTTYSHIGLWGHISARVLVEALRRAGRDVSRERLVDTLEAMRNVDIGQHVVDFSSSKHHGSKFVDITLMGRDERLVK
jgi:branched-chain amino acid transport system substrate-binding protein